MKYVIDKDEAYPIFDFYEDYPFGREIDLSEEEYLEFKRISKDYYDWQYKLSKLYNAGSRRH